MREEVGDGKREIVVMKSDMVKVKDISDFDQSHFLLGSEKREWVEVGYVSWSGGVKEEEEIFVLSFQRSEREERG